jgi:hypothetical protein
MHSWIGAKRWVGDGSAVAHPEVLPLPVNTSLARESLLKSLLARGILKGFIQGYSLGLLGIDEGAQLHGSNGHAYNSRKVYLGQALTTQR